MWSCVCLMFCGKLKLSKENKIFRLYNSNLDVRQTRKDILILIDAAMEHIIASNVVAK